MLWSFSRLFLLTACVAFFVLLMQFFLVYLDEMIGKGLGLSIYMQLSAHVCALAIRQAFPLAILLAAMMTLGGLGEHYELTALKGAGISLTRILWPLCWVSCLLSGLVFFSNSYIAPKAYLDAFSLLYDLGKKKPTIAIKEGVFYDGIPNYSIKIRKKLDDKKTLQDIIIYHHSDEGNTHLSLTMAKTGKIYTTKDETSLVIELFDGHNYTEELLPDSSYDYDGAPTAANAQFYRSNFKAQTITAHLDAFKLSRTDKTLFKHSYKTKNAQQLTADIAVMKQTIKTLNQRLCEKAFPPLVVDRSHIPKDTNLPKTLLKKASILRFRRHMLPHAKDTSSIADRHTANDDPSMASTALYLAADTAPILQQALKKVQVVREQIAQQAIEVGKLETSVKQHRLAKYKMVAWAASCILVFFMGASIGAIIKKGGFGFPLFIATGLIIWHYLFEMLGEKWAIESVIGSFLGAWLPNICLLPFAFFFFKKSHQDAYLFDHDFYAKPLASMQRYLQKIFP